MSRKDPPAEAAAAWDAVLASLCRLQDVLPDAVLVGGTASALYAERRFSFDHDHVLPKLRAHFDQVLAELEAVAGWQTARVTRPVQIFGSLDGVETGVRQLRRARPLETTEMHVGDHVVRLPTLPEALRIKAFLCLDRNATRDYLDVAALASRLGMDASFAALEPMDDLYPQRGDDPWIVRTQLIKQFADPRPYDLDDVDLAEYKGVRPPLDQWDAVSEICLRLSERLLQGFTEMLTADASTVATAARESIEDWQTRRARGDKTAEPRLPGLKG